MVVVQDPDGRGGNGRLVTNRGIHQKWDNEVRCVVALPVRNVPEGRINDKRAQQVINHGRTRACPHL
jgi:hypothetical protein